MKNRFQGGANCLRSSPLRRRTDKNEMANERITKPWASASYQKLIVEDYITLRYTVGDIGCILKIVESLPYNRCLRQGQVRRFRQR